MHPHDPHPWRYMRWENKSWFEANLHYLPWIDHWHAERLCPNHLPVLGKTGDEESPETAP